jgi:ABC-type microcin C transport system permease subunit YejB
MSDVPAVKGSLVDRMIAGIKMSEQKRHDAIQRGDDVREATRRTINTRDRGNRVTTPEAVVEINAAYQADHDPHVAALIAGEQWGARLATMYGVARTAIVAEVIDGKLSTLIEQQVLTNQLLRELINKLTDPR